MLVVRVLLGHGQLFAYSVHLCGRHIIRAVRQFRKLRRDGDRVLWIVKVGMDLQRHRRMRLLAYDHGYRITGLPGIQALCLSG